MAVGISEVDERWERVSSPPPCLEVLQKPSKILVTTVYYSSFLFLVAMASNLIGMVSTVRSFLFLRVKKAGYVTIFVRQLLPLERTATNAETERVGSSLSRCLVCRNHLRRDRFCLFRAFATLAPQNNCQAQFRLRQRWLSANTGCLLTWA